MRLKDRKFFKGKTGGSSYYILIEGGRVSSISKDKPVQIEIFPSMLCNLNCAYCDRGEEDSILEDFNDIKILYDNLKIDPAFNLAKFSISGKEPTLYPKVNELISFLHDLNPNININFLTNCIEIEKLTKSSLKKVELGISVYPHTEKILRKDKYIERLFKKKKYNLSISTFFHQDLNFFGTKRNELNPLSACLSAVLLCGTKRVYPCCRAHRLEQMYKTDYHFYINTADLYKRLKNLICDTNLCVHCPHIYKDCVKVPLGQE